MPMPTSIGSVLLCGALVSVVACGGGSSITPDNYEQQFVELACEKAHSCRSTFPGTPDQFTEIFSTSANACISQNGGEELDPELAAAIDAGTVIFDDMAANTCISILRGLDCAELWTFDEPDECDQIFVGTVEPGGECTLDEECLTDGTPDADPYCSGTCMQF
jgi:hypothetical protein